MTDQENRPSLAQIAATVLGVAIGVIGFRALGPEPELTARLIGGGIAGLLVGLVPYVMGRRSDATLAKVALGVTVVAGVLSGLLLAIPSAGIFAAVIFQRRRAGRSAPHDGEGPGSVSGAGTTPPPPP